MDGKGVCGIRYPPPLLGGGCVTLHESLEPRVGKGQTHAAHGTGHAHLRRDGT
jgi:hypothetical protein